MVVSGAAVYEALRLAGGDRRRLTVVPTSGAIGGAAVIVSDHP